MIATLNALVDLVESDHALWQSWPREGVDVYFYLQLMNINR